MIKSAMVRFDKLLGETAKAYLIIETIIIQNRGRCANEMLKIC